MKHTPTRLVKLRDPSWRARRALGHKVVEDKTRYSRKAKHRKDLRKDGGFFMPGKDISLTVCQTHQATNGHPRPPPGAHITLK